MILRQKIVELENTTYKFVVDNDIRFYRDIEPYKKYLIGIDTSMGVTGDFSAIEVFEFPGFKFVVSFIQHIGFPVYKYLLKILNKL